MDDNKLKPNSSEKQVNNMKILGFASEFGFIIALPLVAFIFLGKYLDNRFNTKYFTLVGVLLALTLSVSWLYKRIKLILENFRKK
jgi:hypothetical protein